MRTDASEQIRGRTEAGDLTFQGGELLLRRRGPTLSSHFRLSPSASNRGYYDMSKAYMYKMVWKLN